jgi:hypothetical protein
MFATIGPNFLAKPAFFLGGRLCPSDLFVQGATGAKLSRQNRTNHLLSPIACISPSGEAI